MNEAADHFVENILPIGHYRQIVFTLPHPLRYWVATNAKLLSKVSQLLNKSIQANLKLRALAQGMKDPHVGTITHIQFFNSALCLSPHFHVLVLDKAFEKKGEEVASRNIEQMNDIDVKEILHNAVIMIKRHLRKRGYIDEESIAEQPPLDELFAAHPRLAGQLAECLFLPRRLQNSAIDPGFGVERDEAIKSGPMCWNQNGFGIHANTRVNPLDRRGLEKLVSYMARPAISEERLSLRDGLVVYKLKRAWSDGRTEVTYSPVVFMKRLASLIPPPRTHLVRHGGIFAPAHPLRKLIAPNPEEKKVYEPEKKKIPACDKEEGARKVKNHSWAKMLKRVFEIDVGTCDACGDDMIIIAAVHDPIQVKRYLKHVGLWPTGPPQPKVDREELAYIKLVTD